ncbi:hypothetical protein R8510_03042 [Ralstonia chuxiongensis]|nr:hypothetical protein R8510_03042 [Ralstonia chuxiongensis]
MDGADLAVMVVHGPQLIAELLRAPATVFEVAVLQLSAKYVSDGDGFADGILVARLPLPAPHCCEPGLKPLASRYRPPESMAIRAMDAINVLPNALVGSHSRPDRKLLWFESCTPHHLRPRRVVSVVFDARDRTHRYVKRTTTTPSRHPDSSSPFIGSDTRPRRVSPQASLASKSRHFDKKTYHNSRMTFPALAEAISPSLQVRASTMRFCATTSTALRAASVRHARKCGRFTLVGHVSAL